MSKLKEIEIAQVPHKTMFLELKKLKCMHTSELLESSYIQELNFHLEENRKDKYRQIIIRIKMQNILGFFVE